MLNWVDNIQTYLGEIGWGVMDQIDLAQDRGQLVAFENMVMNLQIS
jgi:hypothetical protein